MPKAYLSKQIVECIKLVATGGVYLHKKIKNLIDKSILNENILNENIHNNIQLLSKREVDVFKLINEGFENKAIAFKLNISTKTVSFHKESIKQKLGIDSVKDLYNN